ncbi:MAG: class I SAM-dependent methyltransferase [Bacteriovoracales bacterium]|nr:class I SAM-dependent methyltransferase [Bacteriovoracales bacterium]
MKHSTLKSGFGNNFKDYLQRSFDKTRLDQAQESLSDFLKMESFEGKTFLDIGCGAGIFSLSALNLNASFVHSFDLDEESIECSEQLRKQYDIKEERWKIERGNILDRAYVESLGSFDLVYCWGTVHHTGQMWQAIENSLKLVKKGGLIYFGIYNDADHFGLFPDGRFGSSRFWAHIKRFFFHCPKIVQKTVEYAAISAIVLIYTLSFQNPFKKIKEHGKRGMTWRVDLKDWLIGYPYEYASPDRVINYMLSKGFTLKNIRTNTGLLTNHYLFCKAPSIIK